MNSEEITTRTENERQYRVIDQLLTMHSVYKGRMESRAFWLNTSLVAISLFLMVAGFIGDDLIKALGFEPIWTRFLIGVGGVIALIASITEFRVNWQAVAGKHSEAALKLSDLKSKYRITFAERNGNDNEANRILSGEYDKVMSGIPNIPDGWFNGLKAKHEFKRHLSQRISEFPKTPRWFLSLQLRIEGFREAVSRRDRRS